MASHTMPLTDLGRRRFVVALGAAAGLLATSPLRAHVAQPGARTLALRQLNTGESCRVTYWEKGCYLDDGLAELNRVMRDYRTGDIHPIDPSLLDQLSRLQEALDNPKELHVISAFRSQQTNERLRRQSSGVAKLSLHLEGRAVDLRVPGRSTRRIQQAALSLRAGGVGYYEQGRFVHLDTGKVRSW